MRALTKSTASVADSGEVAEWSTIGRRPIAAQANARAASVTPEPMRRASKKQSGVEAGIQEGWQSGRMRRIRNPVYGFTVPWVRIPPLPPEQRAPCGPFRFGGRGWVRSHAGSTSDMPVACREGRRAQHSLGEAGLWHAVRATRFNHSAREGISARLHDRPSSVPAHDPCLLRRVNESRRPVRFA